MSRISKCLEELRQQGRSALIPYVTAGDPAPAYTVDIMHALVEGGADIIELGVPFSDPMADGPVIQLACERALVHNTSLRMVLEMVSQFRQKDSDTPVVLMGYLNPIEAMGMDVFLGAAKGAGVDGVLTVDLPPEEADAVAPQMKEAGMDAIFLLAPTTTKDRIRSAADHGSGYIYYVSLKGVTGSNALDVDDVKTHLEVIRDLTDLPIGVGFGIKDAQTAGAVAKIADGVIVGSKLVSTIAESADEPDAVAGKLRSIMAGMRKEMDA